MTDPKPYTYAQAGVSIAAGNALVRAIGSALAVFATLMQRGGTVPLDEMARMLGIYSVVTSETSPQEGLLLGCWAAILRDAAQVGGDSPQS